VDLLNAFLQFRLFEVYFGEGKVEGGGYIIYVFFDLLPLLWLGGELIASDDRPLGERDILAREQHLGDLHANGGVGFHESS
jgi:hypothetical protein